MATRRKKMTEPQRKERDALRKRLEYRQRKADKFKNLYEAELTTKTGLIRTVEFSRSIRGLTNRDIRSKIKDIDVVLEEDFLKNEFNRTKRAYMSELSSAHPAIHKSTKKFTRSWTWRHWKAFFQSDRFVPVSQLGSDQIQQHFDLLDEINFSKLKPSTQARRKREKARKTLTQEEEAEFFRRMNV